MGTLKKRVGQVDPNLHKSPDDLAYEELERKADLLKGVLEKVCKELRAAVFNEGSSHPANLTVQKAVKVLEDFTEWKNRFC